MTLTDVQRAALALAERLGWAVSIETRDGTRIQVRRGHPQRALVLSLSKAAEPAELTPKGTE